MTKGATISSCGRYRYRLWRQWDHDPRLVFIMLNPSTADGEEDDPTIRKCVGFAERLGFGGIDVVNLFAWRATDYRELARATQRGDDIVGRENDDYIANVLTRDNNSQGRVIVAWGQHAMPYAARVQRVERIIAAEHGPPMCLGKTKWGQPRHPLMLSYNTKLEPWR